MIDKLELGRRALLTGGVGRAEPILIVGGKGATLFDINGKSYIDFTSQAWTYTIGINHPRVVEAAITQIRNITHLRTSFESIPKLLLSERLIRLANNDLKRVNYALHGSVAIEGALKLAQNRKKGPIMGLKHGFHGRTIATMALSWDNSSESKGVVTVPEAYCYRCPYGKNWPSCHLDCANRMEDAIKAKKPSVLIMEAVQGNGGQIEFPREFVQTVRHLCDKYGITFILDDIQTGFGRCGVMFGYELHDTIPDIVVFGKSLGGGFPIAGMLCKDCFSFKPAQHSFTFAHFPVSMAAALATLDVIEEENILEQARYKGLVITNKLKTLQSKYELIGDIRGPGLMIGVELVKSRGTKEPACEEAQEILTYAIENGVIFGIDKHANLGNVIKFKPPVVVTGEQIDKAINVFEDGLARLS